MRNAYDNGVKAAVANFKLAEGPGFLGRQFGAAKDLFYNLRGGMGGAYHPSVAPSGWTPPEPMGIMTGAGNIHPPADFGQTARAFHRQGALGNLRTLAPSLGIAGGLYLLHRHNQAKQEAANQQQQLAGYGQPGY